jgi:hypothetical protein
MFASAKAGWGPGRKRGAQRPHGQAGGRAGGRALHCTGCLRHMCGKYPYALNLVDTAAD